MRKAIVLLSLTLLGCPTAQEAGETKSEQPEIEVKEAESPTALGAIQEVHDSLAADCGENMPELSGLEKLTIPEAEQARADELLAKIGQMAKSCAPDTPVFKKTEEETATCHPDCSWCPVKWYWCLYNSGACAGGDNKSCCKLGACGGKHHCKQVCESSCSCDVPPLPSDGGGGGEEE